MSRALVIFSWLAELVVASAVLAEGWRLVGRATAGPWTVQDMQFYKDAACSVSIPARVRCTASCSATHAPVDGTAVAGPPSPSPAEHALAGSGGWWRSRGACPSGLDACYVGFRWMGMQVGLPGFQAGFSSDAGVTGSSRFVRSATLAKSAVEPQCVTFEHSGFGGSSELVVQYIDTGASNQTISGTDLVWSTLLSTADRNVSLSDGTVSLRLPLA